MLQRLLWGCLIGLVVLAAPDARAQDVAEAGENVRVVLTDGSTVHGRYVRGDEAEVEIETTAGARMIIPRTRIRTIESLRDKKFYRQDPNHTRLFFAPTGRALRRGQGYLAVYEIFVPFVAVGAGHGITLSGGMTINPGSDRLFYVAPKVTVYEQAMGAVGLGGILVVPTGGEGSAGLLFGVGTYGTPERAVTVGLAYGFADGELGNKPALVVGGEWQLTNSIKLLTENYVFVGTKDGVLVSGGIRFFGDALAADIGIITGPWMIGEIDGWFDFFPWLGFAYNF